MYTRVHVSVFKFFIFNLIKKEKGIPGSASFYTRVPGNVF